MNETPSDPLKELAEAFLRWPLPESVCADLCATRQGPNRVGTNLLSYYEARQMIIDVVGPKLAELEWMKQRAERAEATEQRDLESVQYWKDEVDKGWASAKKERRHWKEVREKYRIAFDALIKLRDNPIAAKALQDCINATVDHDEHE